APTSARQPFVGAFCAPFPLRSRTPRYFSMNQEKSLLPLVAIVGPTASGKSTLAVWLAERLGGEVVGWGSPPAYHGLQHRHCKTHRCGASRNSASLDRRP